MYSKHARFAFAVEGDPAPFRVLSFTVSEALSELTRAEIELVMTEPDVAADAVLDKPAVLALFDLGETPVRLFRGVIARFAKGDTPPPEGGSTKWYKYSATMLSSVWRLSQRRDSRIFQKKTAKDIIGEVLKQAGLSSADWRFDLAEDPPERAYCVQYRETDLDFVRRLLAEEGIWHAFDASGDRDVLVMRDANSAAPVIPDGPDLAYQAMGGGVAELDHVSRFAWAKRVASGTAALKDYDFFKPTLDLTAERAGDANAELTVYDFPGGYYPPARGAALAKRWLESLRADVTLGAGLATTPNLAAGLRFKLYGHERDDLNVEYLVVQATHTGSQPQAMEEQAGEGTTEYEVSFACVPVDAPFRPARPGKPVIAGPQSAVVVGPSGEEIYTDEHGRVRVQFHWDRQGKHDAQSSCWVRVAQGMAGAKWGMQFLPRIGQEVIVEFFEGDPDRPVVTGRLYNALNKPPYDLPAQKSRSGVKTDSHLGDGANELMFEDESGKEMIWLHAQKDLLRRILNDALEKTTRDRHAKVLRDDLIKIDGARHADVGADSFEKIGGDLHLKVGGDRVESVGGTANLKASAKIVLEAPGGISFKVGGSFVAITPAGVDIKGPMVNLNSGGSADAAASPSPPKEPLDVDDVIANQSAEAGKATEAGPGSAKTDGAAPPRLEGEEDPENAGEAGPGEEDEGPSPQAAALIAAAAIFAALVEICPREPAGDA